MHTASSHAWTSPSASKGEALACALAAALGLGLLGTGVQLAQSDGAGTLLLAPMVGNLDDCLLQDPVSAQLPLAFRPRPASCDGPQGSAAELLTQTLQPLALKAHAPLKLGYTLNVPLMRMLEPDGNRGWRPDGERIARYVRTLANTDQPAVLYLFATHFGVNSAAEEELLQDEASVAQTRQGLLPKDSYLDYSIYPWSVATHNNRITQARLSVVREVARQVCASPQALAKVEGVSLLGEVHQMYPKFETGMGFESPYLIGDYSPASEQAFRRWLVQRMGTLEALNARLGSQFRSFDEVRPPAKNIRFQKLKHFFEHIDAFAHGRVPVSGWVHVPMLDPADQPLSRSLAQRPWVQVRLNGELIAREQASLSRQDVAQAHPLWRTADLGWRHDLVLTDAPQGTHRLDVLLELPGGQFSTLGTRRIHVMSPAQTTPEPRPMQAELPAVQPLPAGVSAYMDLPRDDMDLYVNPLVLLWHQFREQQVRDYLEGVRKVVAQTCLAQKPIYVHQLYPHGNPSWDATRYALDQSLQHHSGWRVGVSLYGESAYGERVGAFARERRWAAYGITEFHPMRPMTGVQMAQVMGMHRAQGARFLSFFMEAHPQGSEPLRMHNAFSFDAHNPDSGSDALYGAVKQVMEGSAPMPVGARVAALPEHTP